MTVEIQQKLSSDQIAEFYHDEFVRDQVRDFAELATPLDRDGVVVDIGGGVGYFAERVHAKFGYPVRVVDMDPESVARCEARSVPSQLGDALNPPFSGDEACVCFNLILHHLVAEDEERTRGLQIGALRAWKDHETPIFVNEYIYESFVGMLSGRLIYAITSSRLLSAAAAFAARFVPALRANTFGVGVRFRSHGEWLKLFREAGFAAEAVRVGADEDVKPPLRLLLIKAIRRDSFILRPAR
ncbi:hypothetical protein MNQ96_13405 [Sphingopyxis granuli]|uniref:hypothetical protein n=1 Tax=Sphingopyxis granuli TaxID=267128 RepID=UPI001F53CB5E|nr:hypothetical protein [Sphingopyxis granuli]UNK78552.1 hypothetical protein MNQ96_13405 [Sphingopyxis granuli]